jgi:hypothetical protein
MIATTSAYKYASASQCSMADEHLEVVDINGYCNLCGFAEKDDSLYQNDVEEFILMLLHTELDDFLSDDGGFNIEKLVEFSAVKFSNIKWLEDTNHWIWPSALKAVKTFVKCKGKI